MSGPSDAEIALTGNGLWDADTGELLCQFESHGWLDRGEFHMDFVFAIHNNFDEWLEGPNAQPRRFVVHFGVPSWGGTGTCTRIRGTPAKYGIAGNGAFIHIKYEQRCTGAVIF